MTIKKVFNFTSCGAANQLRNTVKVIYSCELGGESIQKLKDLTARVEFSSFTSRLRLYLMATGLNQISTSIERPFITGIQLWFSIIYHGCFISIICCCFAVERISLLALTTSSSSHTTTTTEETPTQNNSSSETYQSIDTGVYNQSTGATIHPIDAINQSTQASNQLTDVNNQTIDGMNQPADLFNQSTGNFNQSAGNFNQSTDVITIENTAKNFTSVYDYIDITNQSTTPPINVSDEFSVVYEIEPVETLSGNTTVNNATAILSVNLTVGLTIFNTSSYPTENVMIPDTNSTNATDSAASFSNNVTDVATKSTVTLTRDLQSTSTVTATATTTTAKLSSMSTKPVIWNINPHKPNLRIPGLYHTIAQSQFTSWLSVVLFCR